MIIDYDVGMLSAKAEARLIKVSQATAASKLKFKVDKVRKSSGFAITIETPFDIFSGYQDMQDYVRALIVDQNKTLHAEEDYMRVRGVLDATS